ncbi:MFS domain-containing protein [Fusarium sp. Ph1]|nr:MFS domain-containing protein [Fusarium sp. Ph1]
MGIFRKASLSRPEGEAGKTWPAIAMGFFVAFGGVLFGYDTGTISGILAMPYWQRLFSTGYVDPNGEPNITTAQESTIVSILSAGTFFGALSTALFSDYLGRRPGLIIACWIFNLGVVLQTIATAIPMFSAGRFFAGFGVGLVSATIPLYQSETAPKWIRAAVVNNATGMRNDTGSYRIPVAVQFAWSLVLFFGMLVLPETPRFLIKKNQPEKAALWLGRIRRLPSDHPAAQAELAEIQASHEYEKSLGQVSYLDCFRLPLLKRQLTGMAIQALQQLSGVNFVFYYGTKYFQNSGISNGFIISMVTSAINVASTVPGMYAIDRWGRRPLLLWGAIGMCVSQLIVAVCGTVSTGQNASTGEIFVKNMAGQKASVAFVCIYIFFFASTWGPLPWVVNGEIFPLTARAKGISMSVATNWLLNWAIAFSTPYLVNYGEGYANLQSKIFFVWFGACFLCIFFVYFFVYETKGLSLEEVELFIQGGQVDGEKVMGTGELSASHHEGKSSESA